MDKKLTEEIGNMVRSFQQTIQSQLPALENEVRQLIDEKTTDCGTIERQLDILLSLTEMGIGDKLFVQLLDYYKTINEEAAMFYWNEYDKADDDL